MGDVTLRQLAKEYANGNLPEDDYRQQRAQMINGILRGEIPLQVNEYPSLIMPEELESLDTTEPRTAKEAAHPAAPTPPAAAVPAPRPASRQLWWIIGAIVVIIVILIPVVWMLSGGDGENGSREETPGMATGSEPAATEVTIDDLVPARPPPTAGQELLSSFLDADDWSVASQDKLLRGWYALKPEELDAARNSVEIAQFANGIYRQLLEENALAGLNTGGASSAARERLLALADSLGIDEPRISAMKTAPATPPVEASTTGPEPEAETETAANTVPLAAPDQAPPQPVPQATAATAPDEEAEQQAATPATAPPVKPAPAPVTAPPATTVAESRPEPAPAPVTAPAPRPAAQQRAPCNTSLLNSRRPYCRDEIGAGISGPTMVVIRPGNFRMGGELDDEQPVHEVTIGYPFAMSMHEITYGEFEQFCNDTGRECPTQPWAGKDYPVVNVSWNDAVAYTRWLSKKSGRTYRLPSESEWEYAARGGTSTAYPFGDDIDISSAIFSYQKQLTAPLPKTDRSINRNKFRLYHIVGNVREWVADAWHDNYVGAPADGSVRAGNAPDRVVRGGSYSDSARELRSAARTSLPADTADNFTGFRVLQEM